MHRFIGEEDADRRLYNKTNNCTEALNGVVGRTFSAENGSPDLTRFSSCIKGIACDVVARMHRIDRRQEDRPNRSPPTFKEVPPSYATFIPPAYLLFGERRVDVGPLPPPPPPVESPPTSPIPPRSNTPPLWLAGDVASPASSNNDLWVMCTGCNKWRKVPDDYRAVVAALGDEDLWTCHQADWYVDVSPDDRCDIPSDG